MSSEEEIIDLTPTDIVKESQIANENGTVVQYNPFGWFWGIVNFFYLFYQTLLNPDFNKHGDKYTRDLRPPGKGPPKPPTRKFGGFGPSGSGPAPPPAGGCGCGG